MIDWAVVDKRVVCVDIKWLQPHRKRKRPILGQILTIREVILSNLGNVCFYFEEISNPIEKVLGVEIKFNNKHFLPVKETNIECFQSILENIPKNVNKEMENV